MLDLDMCKYNTTRDQVYWLAINSQKGQEATAENRTSVKDNIMERHGVLQLTL